MLRKSSSCLTGSVVSWLVSFDSASVSDSVFCGWFGAASDVVPLDSGFAVVVA